MTVRAHQHLLLLAALGWMTLAVVADRTAWQPPRLVSDLIRLTGTSQSWGMFAPSPPRDAHWLHATGRIDGRRKQVEVTLPGGAPTPHVKLHYDRVSKWLRTTSAPKARGDRKRLAQVLCAQQPELVSIRFSRASAASPKPGFTQHGVTKLRPLEQHSCKKKP